MPEKPEVGTRQIAYLEAVRNNKGDQIRYRPAAHQYSFDPAGWRSEYPLPLSGTNLLQFSRLPTLFGDGDISRFMTRPDITYVLAQHYRQLMAGSCAQVCLTVFDHGGTVASLGAKNTGNYRSEITFGGTDEHFVAVTPYKIAQGRISPRRKSRLAGP